MYVLSSQTITNFDDTIGKNAGECLWNQRKYFPHILKQWKPNTEDEDETPLVVQEVDSCVGFLNISGQQEASNKLSVKERFRIEQTRVKFAQTYMQSAWKDFVFINELKNNEILKASTQNAFSFDSINQSIDECVESTSAFIVINCLASFKVVFIAFFFYFTGAIARSMSFIHERSTNVSQ